MNSQPMRMVYGFRTGQKTRSFYLRFVVAGNLDIPGLHVHAYVSNTRYNIDQHVGENQWDQRLPSVSPETKDYTDHKYINHTREIFVVGQCEQESLNRNRDKATEPFLDASLGITSEEQLFDQRSYQDY